MIEGHLIVRCVDAARVAMTQTRLAADEHFV
jgi:hypothetical protein